MAFLLLISRYDLDEETSVTYHKDQAVDIQSDKPDLKRFVAHRVRELSTLSKHLLKSSRPRLIAFPCESWNACSGLLWGRGALKEMESLGWDVVLAPPQLELTQRKRLCKLLKPDGILFLKARTWKNRPHHYPNIPLVFLLDDADFLDPKEHDHVVECTKAAAVVIAANEYVASWCRQHNDHVEKIWVPHVPRQSAPKRSNAQRPNIVMWAPGDPVGYTTESDFVTDVICRLQSTRTDFEFWMTGCKNKEWASTFAKPLLEQGVKLKQFGYFDQYADYLDTIAQTPVGLHPVRLDNDYAHGKSFGKILSYITSDTAVITDTVPDHSDFFNHRANGMLADSIDEYTESISYLFDHPQERQAMVDQAYADFLEQLATPVAAKKLEAAILKAIQSRPKNYTQ